MSYASPLSNVVGDKAQEALRLYNRAYLERDRGNFDTALTQIKDAIAIVENLPTTIPTEELRASYFATVQGYYQLYIADATALAKSRPRIRRTSMGD